MTLFEKSMQILELPAVLQMLAEQAVSDPAKEAALALQPDTEPYEIRRRLTETSAAKTMMAVRGGPSFSGVKDVSASLSRADRGGMLNTRELLDIAAVLHAARAVSSYGAGESVGRSELDGLFSALRANRTLEEKISTSILSEEEIADGASSELADIRRHMRIAGDKVRQSLQKIITSPAYSKALQEPIITMRNDRYVVPVRAEHKSSVPGLVHDISSSGATLFVEPMSAVQANNEIRELLAREKNEIDRILMALSAEAAADREDIIRDFRILVELDLIFAKAKLSYALDCTEPELAEDGQLLLRRARHPLLPVKTAVPIDVRLGGDFDTLVITGPNTGGKTVTLKTLGLHCLMAQCGLHIPAGDGSRVPVYRRILADIGDEQSIEQSLSTFSSHMKNIVQILDECGEGTMLLFDELGAGTDPVEGAALAISIIEYARQHGSVIAATTHYAELKVYATTSAGVQNASCEFDVETLQPTFRLLIGIPGKSNAFAISARLGLAEDIIQDARARIDAESASFEEVLENLEEMRQQMEKEQLETRRLLRKAEEDAKTAEQYKQETETAREKAAVTARREANQILTDARHAAEEVFDELNAMRRQAAKEGDWQRVNDARAEARRKLNEAEAQLQTGEPETAPPPSSRPVRPGDTVEILGIGARAEVISIGPDRTLTLQAGILKVTAKEDEVRLVEGAKPKTKPAPQSAGSTSLRNGVIRPELDLRGMMTDEAIPVLERYLDGAQRAKLESVTVIHGKGTGALRAAVHAALRKNSQVKSFRLGRYGEGETGVTIVEIR